MTNGCNLNCVYCFRGEHKDKKISFETLDNVLNSIIEYSTKKKSNFVIQAWGGEPLIEIKKVLYIRKYFNHLGIHPSITVETNGLLLNEKNVTKLLSNDISFGISIDGDKIVQDGQRPLPDGSGSFDLIKNNILKIKQKYPLLPLSALVVITKESYKRVKEIIDCLVKELGFTNLKINLVRSNDSSPKKIEELNDKEIRWTYNTVFWKINELVSKGYKISEGNISIRASNLFKGNIQDICLSRGCQGGYKMIAFDVNGEIYNCELIGDESQHIGNYNSDFDQSVIASKESGNPYFKEKKIDKCNKCKYYEFCKGGCSTHILHTNKDIDEQMCSINKKLYPLIKLSKLLRLPIYKTLPKGAK